MTRWTNIALLLAMAAAAPARAGVNEDLLDCVAHGRDLLRTDSAKVVAACSRLASADNAEGQFHLGMLYENGQGVTQNYGQAVAWYRAAADQGLAAAQFSIGYMYERGLGVPQDNVQAHLWYNLAAAQGNQDAAQARDFVAHRMTLPQIAAAQKLAAGWRPKIGS